MNNFKELGLSDRTINILDKKGYTEPTEIQRKAIPMLLSGAKDIVGMSQTGTGKTASFALPILEKIKAKDYVSTLILAPTRELAMQVKTEIDSLKGDRNIRTLTVYGGAPIGPQMKKLEEGVDIVVGTPGRVIDLINRRKLKLEFVDYVVLDEADEMLNMGFVEDIEEILSSVKDDRQMLLFSATMPKQILTIAKKFMRNYETIEVEKTNITTDLIEQVYYDVMSTDRVEVLKRIIDTTDKFYGIIFCKTKMRVDDLFSKLDNLGYHVAALHGDVSQGQREQILASFKKKKINILVATDVAARGIDVNDLTHVINYSLPQSPEIYVHRIGRTGRAGKKGKAITFVIPSEKRKQKFVEKIIGFKLERGAIPTIEEIYRIKQEKSLASIHSVIEKSRASVRFERIADDLLQTYDSKELLVALLQFGFKKNLSMDGYKELKKLKTASEIKSKDKRPKSKNKDSRREGKGRNVGKSKGRRKSSERNDGNRGFKKNRESSRLERGATGKKDPKKNKKGDGSFAGDKSSKKKRRNKRLTKKLESSRKKKQS